MQWLQLPEPERRTGEGLDAALVEQLNKLASRNDESLQIAAVLAARLGLQRVYATDDHTDDSLDIEDSEAYKRALKEAWFAGGTKHNKLAKQVDALKQAADLLPLYRHINGKTYQTTVADAEVRSTMRGKSPERYSQMWAAGWEIRNLRMVANIRETFRQRQGASVLSIVGSSHKPWFDSWLGQLQGVDIVDVGTVLK